MANEVYSIILIRNAYECTIPLMLFLFLFLVSSNLYDWFEAACLTIFCILSCSLQLYVWSPFYFYSSSISCLMYFSLGLAGRLLPFFISFCLRWQWNRPDWVRLLLSWKTMKQNYGKVAGFHKIKEWNKVNHA